MDREIELYQWDRSSRLTCGRFAPTQLWRCCREACIFPHGEVWSNAGTKTVHTSATQQSIFENRDLPPKYVDIANGRGGVGGTLESAIFLVQEIPRL